MQSPKPTLHIYLGSPIGHESERRFLSAAAAYLQNAGVAAVILANVEIGGRQLDCVVCTDHGVSVIEVKQTYLPVRGQINGAWGRLTASGEQAPYTNAYRQALAGKNSLRDAMASFNPPVGYYPNGYVVFMGGLPKGSDITSGDHKVAVRCMEACFAGIVAAQGSPWRLTDWSAFAAKLSLMRVGEDEALAPRNRQIDLDRLKRYRVAIVSEYAPSGRTWLSEVPEASNALLAAAQQNAGCYIRGPSGCGKTLMVKWLASEFAGVGAVPLVLTAKEFTGSWAAAIRREISLLTDDNPAEVIAAITRLEAPVVIFLDGINELGANRESALRGIRALARRFHARLVLTGQGEQPSGFEGLKAFPVVPPSLALKQRIASGTSRVLTSSMIDVLRAVTSGIEASIVGRIGGELQANATRPLLIDQYVRLRLGSHARTGSFALRKLAIQLHDRIAYSLPELDFDSSMQAQSIGFADCDALFAAGLLVRRAGRVSFAHEMLQNACAAVELASQAVTAVDTYGTRLSTPLLEPLAPDILAVIEDTNACEALLAQVTRPKLLVAAAGGTLGPFARQAAHRLLEEAARNCASEIDQAHLVFSDTGERPSVEWAQEGLRDWTAAEQARLVAIGICAVNETDPRTYLDLCERMDRRLAVEHQRLAEAARAKKYPLRSQSFGLTYLGLGQAIGFTTVARATQPGFERPGLDRAPFNNRAKNATSGQLYFYLESRFFENTSPDDMAEILIFLIAERFRYEPYHVQLAILYAVPYARNAADHALQRLVEAIGAIDMPPENWAINTSIIDALKLLGALDDEAESARAGIKAQLNSVLRAERGEADPELARMLCFSMFDHPFDSVYAEEIHSLTETEQHTLYRCAIRGLELGRAFSGDWLVQKLAAFDDPTDIDLFRPLTVLPSPTNPMWQDEWRGFAAAVRFVGRHRGTLIGVEPEGLAEACLTDIRTLIYLVEDAIRSDGREVAAIWARLAVLPPQLVVGCLSEAHEALRNRFSVSETDKAYPPIIISQVYPEECLRISRRFVDDGMPITSYHRVPHLEYGLSFAFDVIATYGDRSDIERLRSRSRAHGFARYALDALRALEQRI